MIIVNDGSTDHTQKIIDQYARKHAHIRGIYQDNRGVATARNRGRNRQLQWANRLVKGLLFDWRSVEGR